MWPFKDHRADAEAQLDHLNRNGRDENERMFRGCKNSFESSTFAENIPVVYVVLNRKYSAILASDREKAIFERCFDHL